MKPFREWSRVMQIFLAVAWVLVCVPLLHLVLPRGGRSLGQDYVLGFTGMTVTALLPRLVARKNAQSRVERRRVAVRRPRGDR